METSFVCKTGAYSQSTHEQVATTLKLLRYYKTFLASDFTLALSPNKKDRWRGEEITKEEARCELDDLVTIAIFRKGWEYVRCKESELPRNWRHDEEINMAHDAWMLSDWKERRIRPRRRFSSKWFHKNLGHILDAYWQDED